MSTRDPVSFYHPRNEVPPGRPDNQSRRDIITDINHADRAMIMPTPIISQKHPIFLHSVSLRLSQAVDLAHYEADHHLDQALLALADAEYHLDRHIAARQDLRRLEDQISTEVAS